MDNELLTRYKQAQTIMQGYQTNRLVCNDAVFPHWISNSQCFWYIRKTHSGKEYRLVNAPATSNEEAFNHEALATQLGKLTNQILDPKNLPITGVSIDLAPRKVSFKYQNKYWEYSSDENACYETKNSSSSQREILSPDATKVAYIKNHNLWIRDDMSGDEYALTKDGTQVNSYASGILNLDSSVQAVWSPDSKYIFTVQLDTQNVRNRSIVNFVPSNGDLHPKVSDVKVAYPGDKYVESYRLVIIEVSSGDSLVPNYPLLPYVQHGMDCDGFFTGGMGWWSNDSKTTFFIDVSLGSKTVSLVELDINTGATRVLFEESRNTFIRMNEDIFSSPMFLPIPETNELIWFSERDNWAHLYLYDLNSGELKHQITKGEYLVRNILHYAPKKRELILQTAYRDHSINPYYRDICKVNIDTCKSTTLINGNFDHIVYYPKHYCVHMRKSNDIENDDVSGISPCGNFVVTTRSRVDTIPESVLIDRYGNNILTIEVADTSSLPQGWQWPEPLKLTAADGKTEIFGVLFRPLDFSEDKKYPVIDFTVSMRLLSHCPTGAFVNQYIGNYFEMAALAALGFIVVGIVGRGTPYRDKPFQDHNFGKSGYDDDLNDHIAGIKQLARKHSYMDIERVGITSMEGAENVIYGALNHSDFYKVTVSHAFGDPRFVLAPLSTYSGIINEETLSVAGGPEVNIDLFDGKLLLIHGVVIGAEPMFRLVESLQKANKDFDMICLPNLTSQISSYTRRRGWDYFVRHLLNLEPPKNFKLRTGEDIFTENSELPIPIEMLEDTALC